MKKPKRLIVTIGILVLLCSGYMIFDKNKVTNDPDKARDQILSFLEKKYGKEFVPVSMQMDYYPYHYDYLRAYPKGGDKNKEIFDAYRERKNGKYVFSDSYFGVLTHDEYEKKIQEIADEFFSECKVVVGYTGDSFPNELRTSSQLQEALDKKVYNLNIHIKVSPTLKNVEEFNNNVNSFIRKVIEKKIKGSILIVYLKGNDLNTDISEANTYQKRRFIFINSNYEISED